MSSFILILLLLVMQILAKDCLECMCEEESNCSPRPPGTDSRGCKYDASAGGEVCGYFQIKEDYYKDCGEPDKRHWESTAEAHVRCAGDKSCAKRCVEQYARNFKSKCASGMSHCEAMSRLHNGGMGNCNSGHSLNYYRRVEACMRK